MCRGQEDGGDPVLIQVDAAWDPTGAVAAEVTFVNGWQKACWYQRGHAHSPLQAVATALLISARVARSMNRSSILLLSDSSELVTFVNGRSSPSWDCKYIAQDSFDVAVSFGIWNSELP